VNNGEAAKLEWIVAVALDLSLQGTAPTGHETLSAIRSKREEAFQKS